jgi:2-methylisocitrate lyase-like PEP mutase family enzyme
MPSTAQENRAIDPWFARRTILDRPDRRALVDKLLVANAIAIKLQTHVHFVNFNVQPPDQILIPVDAAIRRLASAREIALAIGIPIKIFACTEARSAIGLASDSDKRDHRYLCGLTSPAGDNFAYCGGLDASIDRALLYARYADVVCFKSAEPDANEAARFASALKTDFPEKQLAFGYSPKPCSSWNELDHTNLHSRLKVLGYDYYFFTQFRSPVFSHFPLDSSWVMFDDLLRHRPVEHSVSVL